MAITIYNSLTRTKVPFEPLTPGQITMYVCGPTVYDEPHIGHARSAYIFEVIRRYLIFRGYRVTFVRNVTDVDDKIIDKARKEYPGEDLNAAFRKVSEKYLDAYHRGLENLGIGLKSPDIREPRASEYIAKMIDFIKVLIAREAAYPAGSDVYFDITKAKNYGKLSNQSLDKMESGARVSPTENKKNPLDFALWKSAKENEPFWESPWGRGRPGWHIECSVMSSDILGDEFDIHGGGIDLIFPHHENEVVQSEGAGKPFARYWIHHGLLTINGQKMAKSLGNFVTIDDALAAHHADVLKIFFLQAHYSSPVDFSGKKMEEAAQAYERIASLKKKLEKKYAAINLEGARSGGAGFVGPFEERFLESMDDDFNTPRGLAVLFDLVNSCNKLLDDEGDGLKSFKLRCALGFLEQAAGLFGLTFLQKPSAGMSEEAIAAQVAARAAHKRNKQFSEADAIRKNLEANGIILEDTKDGTTWRRKV